MDMHGNAWKCMDMHGHAWTCMDMHGHAWTCMDMYGNPRDMHGFWCLLVTALRLSLFQKRDSRSANGKRVFWGVGCASEGIESSFFPVCKLLKVTCKSWKKLQKVKKLQPSNLQKLRKSRKKSKSNLQKLPKS